MRDGAVELAADVGIFFGLGFEGGEEGVVDCVLDVESGGGRADLSHVAFYFED